MSASAWRVELELEAGRADPVGDGARSALAARGLDALGEVRSGRGYLLPAALAREEVERIARRLLADAVTETVRIVPPGGVQERGASTLLVRRVAGVTDPEAHTVERALALVDVALPAGARVESYRTFRVAGAAPRERLLEAGARALANPVIESVQLGDEPVRRHAEPPQRAATRREIPLRGRDDSALAELSAAMGLALSVAEMRAIRDHFAAQDREPTDVELETFAQTWSEHCKHKTLTGPVHFTLRDEDGALLEERRYGNLLKETVFAATRRLAPEWCWSVFRDNAGVVALTDEIGVAIKVETHNHPSALDPYGGAGTGVGGVIRDVLGTGLGARPFANLDVFCVGPQGAEAGALPPGTMHPDRVLAGVIAGVRDYGNRMGIPTVAGTVIRHPGYVANPLVYCGSLGEIPRSCVEKAARPGDAIVALGGRTGRDGIHGATFSSEALHEESETADAAAVQIGDPITEKTVLDVLLIARDRGCFTALTDCGAGGFSSAVGEMGEDCGAEVDLERAPLKYPGLAPWEVWISEAQERMVAAVPQAKLAELRALCALHEVELTVLGKFRDDGRLLLRWHGTVLGDLDMEFLHGGVPQPERAAFAVRRRRGATAWPQPAPDAGALLLRVLAHPQVRSKEEIVRTYDHEVQGATVLKPYQGATGRGAGDGVVMKPLFHRPEGIALAVGIAPRIAELDAAAGALCAVDEAIRNVVAAGGDPHRTALLDNFCWGDCRKPDRFGTLVQAAQACHDAALAYGAPFVSGKDSLNNEYRVGGVERPIPPTLLITALAHVGDCARTVGTPLRAAGNLLVQFGRTRAESGGAVAADLLGLPDSAPALPDLAAAPALFAAVHEAIGAGDLVACHDLSEGGLAVAVAEMVIGSSGLGARLDASRAVCDAGVATTGRLFGESPTRFLAEVPADRLDACARTFRTLPWAVVGEVLAEPVLELRDGERVLARLGAEALAAANGVPGVKAPEAGA
jgi:phosphoribosylformylglycinamidine synthase II